MTLVLDAVGDLSVKFAGEAVQDLQQGPLSSRLVKPFNFLLRFPPLLAVLQPDTKESSWAPNEEQKKSVSAFDMEIMKVSKTAFDRETGLPISPELLKTYCQA